MTTPKSQKPTSAELLAAKDKTVPDVIASGLDVLFCGINPGLYTAAIGHHFGRPGNRFWPTLHAAGFTDRLLDPSEEKELLPLGFGITNVVARATAAADELSDEEVIAGGKSLQKRVMMFTPRYLAILGIGAYRTAFAHPKATLGLQTDSIGETKIWVLPNPSGLNAHYQKNDLERVFFELREAVLAESASGGIPEVPQRRE